MKATFQSRVDTLAVEHDGVSVTFSDKAGRYRVLAAPADVVESLREALYSGAEVQVIYDMATLEIFDVTLS